MKKIYLNLIMIFGVIMISTNFGCNDFLDKQPLGALSASNVVNKAGINALLIGAYSVLDGQVGLTNLAGVAGVVNPTGITYASACSNWIYGSVCADDSYKGSTPTDQPPIVQLATWSLSATGGTNTYMNYKWAILYTGIQRANEVLRSLPQATDIDASEAKRLDAESKFLRAFYHMDAQKMWNYPPYVDETVTVDNANLNVPNVDAAGGFISIWPKIEADLVFAKDNLPAVQAQVGRVNKWAAQAFLAKAFMAQDKYAQAKPLLEELISSGVTAKGDKYALVNFESNFNAQTKNGPESVFACQMSVNDGSQLNGNFGDVLNFPNGAGAPGGCCGFNNPSYNLANAYKTDDAGLPLLDTYNSGPGVNDGNASNVYTGNLDPRIDWTIGRPGVPYLDYGPHTTNWIRDLSVNGVFNPKKNVYAKSQFGNLSSNETAFWGATQINANNYIFIRFADIILWAAECEAETGSLDKAQEYVNQIRNRAADPAGWVYNGANYNATSAKYTITASSTPADKYKIAAWPAGKFSGGGKDFARKAIQFERRLELAMEGHRFFDLQRWDNGTGSMANILQTYQTVEKTRKSFHSVNPTAVFTKGVSEFFPLPQTQIDLENSTGKIVLKQLPGYN
ncbi:MAG: RagB/SusD family nutrient uptake outer membrane protein [Saprospiraceae bacterium]